MNLWCLDDKGSWGQALSAEACRRNYTTTMFNDIWLKSNVYAGPPPGAYVFTRLAQETDRLAREKQIVLTLRSRGIHLIPDARSALMYEDKLAQTRAFWRWMPDTRTYIDAQIAHGDVEHWKYPFLSKSATGSASRNIRIIENREQAHAEVRAAFGDGLDAPHKLGEGVQKGYLIWQEIIPDNAYDYRIVRVGRRMMVLQRHNKPGTIFASGSGINNPANVFNEEVQSALEFADDFFSTECISWGGIDIVYDHYSQAWKLLEITLGFKWSAYYNCKFFGTKYTGREMFELLLDEIEIGVFS